MALKYYTDCKDLLGNLSITLVFGEKLNTNAIVSKIKSLNAREYFYKVEELFKEAQYDQVVQLLNPIFSVETGHDEIVDLAKITITGEDGFYRRVFFRRILFDVPNF